jgi:hypothetical protein
MVFIAKAVKMSRPVNAEEWAMRQASAIAEKHMPDAGFEAQSDLMADIAEALTHVKRSWDTTKS